MGHAFSSCDTPLVEAAFAGDENRLKHLLAAGGNPIQTVTIKRYGEVSPVIAAVHSNQLRAVRLLLENTTAAEVNMRFGTRKLTALHVAAGEGRDEICETLLSKGADQRLPDDEGNTALHLAILSRRLSTVWVLTQHAKQCYSHGFYNLTNVKGQTALHAACDLGDLAIVSCLLKAGADPDFPMKGRGRNGCSPLYVAVLTGHDEVVGALLTAGCRIDTVDETKRGLTLMHLAVLLNHPKIVRLLMEHGVDIETGHTKDAPVSEDTPPDMPSPLLVAAAYGRVDCFKEMLNAPQGDVDRCIEKGGRIDLLALVVEKIVGRVPETPETPMSWAVQYPCRFVHRSMKVLGFKGNFQFTTGVENMTKGHFLCVELLLLSGAGITSEQLLRLQQNLVHAQSTGSADKDLERLQEMINQNLWQCSKCGLWGLWPDDDDAVERFCSQHCLLAHNVHS